MTQSLRLARPVPFRVFGSQSPLAQVARIRDGLLSLGCVESDETNSDNSCKLVYANDSGHHQAALDWRDKYAPTAKVILTVLDIPEHCYPPSGDFGPDKLFALGNTLKRADALCSISRFTQSQIIRIFGLSNTVIYNPVKDVAPDIRISGARPYPYRVLISGRTLDPNKRIGTLAIPALIGAGFNESEVAIVGGEYPGWGTNLGLVSDGMLNDLLNSVDYVMSTTLCTGLELGPIEGMICGAIPILTYDTSTFSEIGYPKHWGCHPTVMSLTYRLMALNSYEQLRNGDREYCLSAGEGLAEKLNKQAVARRILEVYDRDFAQKTD